jgi:hypothetical protein
VQEEYYTRRSVFWQGRLAGMNPLRRIA